MCPQAPPEGMFQNEGMFFLTFVICIVFFGGAVFCYLELNTAGDTKSYNVRRCWTAAGLFCIGVPVIKMLSFLF